MDEILKNNAYRLLELFIGYSDKDFSARGIARKLRLNHATVLKYLKNLLESGLVRKKEETLYPMYYANSESSKFRRYKKDYIVFKIIESGLIDYLQENTLASLIVLFGSCAKGEFTEQSDVDVFLQAKKSVLDIRKFERKLGRKISILFEANVNNLSKELKNNIINGVVLYGFIKIK